jgi:hypothetical protein
VTGLVLLLAVAATTVQVSAPAGAQACGDCHGTTFEGWRASAHSAAATNPIYRAGFRVEPRQFCVDCHTSTGARAEEGIGCASCHAARAAPGTATATSGHAVALRTRADLRDPAFCRDCHEFATPAFEGGTMRMTDLPMQRTYSEWLAYRDAGGRETCQSCHMPGGDHAMRGAHDVELLRGSLTVTASADARGARLTLASVGVGHGFPSGDLFRHLTVEVRPAGDPRARDGEEAWRVVDRMGRMFETRFDGRTLQAYKVETANTVLAPGVPRVVRLPPTRGELIWRVRYHYGSERDERRGLVPAEALFVTLATGTAGQARRCEPHPVAGQGESPWAAWPAFSRARSRRLRAEVSVGSRATAALYSRSASR